MFYICISTTSRMQPLSRLRWLSHKILGMGNGSEVLEVRTVYASQSLLFTRLTSLLSSDAKASASTTLTGFSACSKIPSCSLPQPGKHIVSASITRSVHCYLFSQDLTKPSWYPERRPNMLLLTINGKKKMQIQ